MDDCWNIEEWLLPYYETVYVSSFLILYSYIIIVGVQYFIKNYYKAIEITTRLMTTNILLAIALAFSKSAFGRAFSMSVGWAAKSEKSSWIYFDLGFSVATLTSWSIFFAEPTLFSAVPVLANYVAAISLMFSGLAVECPNQQHWANLFTAASIVILCLSGIYVLVVFRSDDRPQDNQQDHSIGNAPAASVRQRGLQIGNKVLWAVSIFALIAVTTQIRPHANGHTFAQSESDSFDPTIFRRCVVALWRDVATTDVDALLSSSVGALVIVIPVDLDALSTADRTLFSDMERRLAIVRSELAIYVVRSNENILPFDDVSSVSAQNSPVFRKFEYKHSFRAPNLALGDGSVPFWLISGDGIASGEQRCLAPSMRSRKGIAWNKRPMTESEHFQIDISLKITSQGRIGADGLGIWYTNQLGSLGPVFGANDFWTGMGVFLDSFDNDGQKNNPNVALMINDGTRSYDHHTDGTQQILSSCQCDFRNKPYPVRLRIEYLKNVLTIHVDDGMQPTPRYELCMRAENIFLPRNGFFGVSAATGGLADDHDVLDFSVSSLYADHQKPAASNDQMQQAERQQYDAEFERQMKEYEAERAKFKEAHPDKAKDDDEFDDPNKCYEDATSQMSSSQISDAVELEFQAFRMHQYELNGNQYGSKNFKVQYEAVSLDTTILRRCVVALWSDIATKDVDALLSSSVGALLIVIPADLDALSPADRTLFSDMERRLATVRSELAIYVVQSNEKILYVLGDVASSSGTATATQQLLNTVSANTFQFTSTGSYGGAPLSFTPQNVIGRLQGSDSNAPTIIFVAHYDSHSTFPALSAGADSNGSGVVMLLELFAIISRFYENPVTPPMYNLVFAWTAGGKYNYQGTRAFIEGIQNGNIVDSDKVELAICIDSVGGPGNLHLHASKQPSEGSAASQLLRRLKLSAPNQSVELVTKKINLNAPMLSWEHERFNIKRMPAVTLSRLPTPDDSMRVSMLDTPAQISLENLERNIRTVAEAVLGYILALPDTGFSSDSHVTSYSSVLSQDAVDRQRLAHFVRQFAQKPRPMCDEAATKAAAANIAAAVGSLTKSVSIEPVQLVDVQVWGGASDKLLAEQVKPAVFELFVSAFVFSVLAVIYNVVSRAQRWIDGIVNFLRKRV